MISVILPTYDGDAYLDECLESIVGQDGIDDFEVVVSDDGSSDETVNIVRSFPDDRVWLRRNERNLGVAGNINSAVDAASGEILAFIDQDDLWYPEKLRRHIDTHERTDSALVYSDLEQIDAEGERIAVSRLPSPTGSKSEFVDCLLGHNNFIPCPSCVTVRRDVWETLDGLNTSLEVAPDFDFYLRLARDHDIAHIDTLLAKRRIHGHNHANNFRQLYRDCMRVLELNSDWLDREAQERARSEIARNRASRELQTGNPVATLRYLRESIASRPSQVDTNRVKALGLAVLAVTELVSGPLHLGRRLHRRYLGAGTLRI